MATTTKPKTAKALLERISNSLKNTIAQNAKKVEEEHKLPRKEIQKREIVKDTAIMTTNMRIL